MLLQAAYEVKEAQRQQRKAAPPILSKLRKALFWDTDIKTIDWDRHKRAIIQRVFERGSEPEIEALIQFYGIEGVRKEPAQFSQSFSPHFEENVKKYWAEPNCK